MSEFASNAAQILLALVPIIAIVMASVVLFFHLLWRHREQMNSIKMGHSQKNEFPLETFCLLSGLMLTPVGLAVSVLLFVKEGVSYGVLGGLVPFALGIGLLVFYGIYLKRNSGK